MDKPLIPDPATPEAETISAWLVQEAARLNVAPSTLTMRAVGDTALGPRILQSGRRMRIDTLQRLVEGVDRLRKQRGIPAPSETAAEGAP